MTHLLDYYKRLIAAAKTVDDLKDITYAALRDDDECTVFSKKYNKIVTMAVRRSIDMEE